MEQNAFPKGLQQCPIFSDVFHILLSVYNHTNCLMRCYTNSYSIINPLSWIELMLYPFLVQKVFRSSISASTLFRYNFSVRLGIIVCFALL